MLFIVLFLYSMGHSFCYATYMFYTAFPQFCVNHVILHNIYILDGINTVFISCNTPILHYVNINMNGVLNHWLQFVYGNNKEYITTLEY